MTDDAIRKALEAAQQTFCSAMTGGECECGTGTRAPRCGADYMVVAAIAAFLRALPTAFDARDWPLPLPGGMHVNRINRWSVETMWRPNLLAAAVERAAQEDQR